MAVVASACFLHQTEAYLSVHVRGGMCVPQRVLWGYGWAVWYALALNKTKWILLPINCLYYHTIPGIVASNVVLAVVMYCLMLSFSSRISPIPYVALKSHSPNPHLQPRTPKPQKQVSTPGSTRKRPRSLPSLLSPHALILQHLSASHQKKRKKTRKPACKP